MAYKTVVVGTDGSETASRAVRHAGQLSGQYDARLVIVSAYTAHHASGMDHLAGTPPEEIARKQAEVPEELRWTLTDRAQAETLASEGRKLAKDAGAGEVVVSSDAGDPAEVILETSKYFNGELIVVGSVGLAGTSRFFLGSVATAVLHHAPCDVLVVHTTD